MIKTLRNLLKQDKERFVVPRGVQDVIPIKVIGVDYTRGILFTGLGDGGLSVGGHFQYVFPNTEGGVLNDMIAAEVHKNLFHLTFLLNTNFPQSIMF